MIKLAKLVSQEFVIGRHIDNVLTNVASVQFNTNAMTGEQGLKIIPYMAPITQSLAKILTTDKIIWMEDAPQQLQISYLEMLKVMLQKVEEANTAAEAEANTAAEADKANEAKTNEGDNNDGSDRSDGGSKSDTNSPEDS